MRFSPRQIMEFTLLSSLLATMPAHGEPADKKPLAVKRGAEGVVTVHPVTPIDTRQGLPNFVGISSETAHAKHLSMNIVVIPPGGAAKPHIHKGFESAVYLIQGNVETRYGENLAHSMVNKAGDFLFIPPNVPHQPRNLSDTEPAIAIVTRNDPNEQESVEHYAPKDAAPTAAPKKQPAK